MILVAGEATSADDVASTADATTAADEVVVVDAEDEVDVTDDDIADDDVSGEDVDVDCKVHAIMMVLIAKSLLTKMSMLMPSLMMMKSMMTMNGFFAALSPLWLRKLSSMRSMSFNSCLCMLICKMMTSLLMILMKMSSAKCLMKTKIYSS